MTTNRSSLPMSLLAAAVLAALAACSSTPLDAPAPAPVTTAGPGAPAAGPGARGAESGVATVTLDPLDDPKSGLADRAVYFGYDEYTVAPKYEPLVQTHGRYLQSRPTVQVRVEGNTDERGSREYNLALGEKRAQAVARQLELLGVRGGQVEAVSFGAERPKAEGHDDAAWAENRRADIRYLKR